MENPATEGDGSGCITLLVGLTPTGNAHTFVPSGTRGQPTLCSQVVFYETYCCVHKLAP